MTPENPLVSIIIPTYNRAHLIGETLDSVLAQTYQNWECIVVDDGSTDNTEELMAEYMTKDARFQYHHRPKDRLPGGNAARNYGFEVSKGEYVQWFDDDDIMLPDFVTRKQMTFTNETSLVICTGYSADENLKNKKLKEMPQIDNLFKDYVLWNSKIMLPSVMFRKGFLIENKELFNEQLKRGQENDLFSRLFFKLSEKKYRIINKGLYLYRQHNSTKSFEDKNDYRSDYKKSMAVVSLRNLERGIYLKDTEIINYHYRIVIHYLFEAIYKKDFKLGWFLLKKLMNVFKAYNKIFVLQLTGWISLFLVSGRPIYKIEKRFKNKMFS